MEAESKKAENSQLKQVDSWFVKLVKISSYFYVINVMYRMFIGVEKYWAPLIVSIMIVVALWKKGKAGWSFIITCASVLCMIHGLQIVWTGTFILSGESGSHSVEIILRRAILLIYFLTLWLFCLRREEWFIVDKKAVALWKQIVSVILALCIPLYPYVEDNIKVLMDPTLIKYPSSMDDCYNMQFSADGKKIVVVQEGILFSWDLKTKKVNKIKAIHGDITSIAFSADGKYLALGTRPLKNNYDGNVYIDILDLSTGQMSSIYRKDLFEHKKNHQIVSVKFNPDNKSLAVAIGGYDLESTVIDIWNVDTWKIEKTLEWKQQLSRLIYSPNGEMLASGRGKSGIIYLWNIEKGKIIKNFQATYNGVAHQSKLSPDGKYIALAYEKTMPIGKSKAGSHKGIIEIFNLSNGDRIKEIEWDSDVRVSYIDYSPDGKYLASCGDENIVRIWDTENGEQVKVLEGHPEKLLRNGLAYSPDGKYIAAAGMNYIKIWDIQR